MFRSVPNSTTYVTLISRTGRYWNGSAYEDFRPERQSVYKIAATEGSVGQFTFTMPSGAVADLGRVEPRLQLSASAIAADPFVVAFYDNFTIYPVRNLEHYLGVKYVDPSGSNSNSGNSPDAPYLTIRKAGQNAVAGWAIKVKEGAYAETAAVLKSGVILFGSGKASTIATFSFASGNLVNYNSDNVEGGGSGIYDISLKSTLDQISFAFLVANNGGNESDWLGLGNVSLTCDSDILGSVGTSVRGFDVQGYSKWDWTHNVDSLVLDGFVMQTQGPSIVTNGGTQTEANGFSIDPLLGIGSILRNGTISVSAALTGPNIGVTVAATGVLDLYGVAITTSSGASDKDILVNGGGVCRIHEGTTWTDSKRTGTITIVPNSGTDSPVAVPAVFSETQPNAEQVTVGELVMGMRLILRNAGVADSSDTNYDTASKHYFIQQILKNFVRRTRCNWRVDEFAFTEGSNVIDLTSLPGFSTERIMRIWINDERCPLTVIGDDAMSEKIACSGTRSSRPRYISFSASTGIARTEVLSDDAYTGKIKWTPPLVKWTPGDASVGGLVINMPGDLAEQAVEKGCIWYMQRNQPECAAIVAQSKKDYEEFVMMNMGAGGDGVTSVEVEPSRSLCDWLQR